MKKTSNTTKIKHSDITVCRHRTDGFTLSAIVDGYLFHRRYLYYTLKEARALFIEEATELTARGGRNV